MAYDHKQPSRQPSQWASFLVLLLLMVSLAASAGDKEDRVKGGFLYNFTKFVDWPADAFSGADAPIVISILGDDPFGPEFDEALKTERSHGRKIEIRRIKRVEDAAGCHILYISRSEKSRILEILKQASNILTVADGDSFARQGGVIQFVVVDGKVRFIINTDAEQRAGLKISSDLKRIATEIVRK